MDMTLDGHDDWTFSKIFGHNREILDYVEYVNVNDWAIQRETS